MAEMRLIDANALDRNFVDSCIGNCRRCSLNSVEHGAYGCGLIYLAPTIDAVPVVHGQWVETGKVFVHSMYDLFTKCSLCSFGHVRNEYQEPYRYCPNCGAKMDGQDATTPTKSDRGCATCANDGFDMPQCRECTEHPGYPWYKRRDGGAE